VFPLVLRITERVDIFRVELAIGNSTLPEVGAEPLSEGATTTKVVFFRNSV